MYKQTTTQKDLTVGIIPSAPWRVAAVECIGDYRLKIRFVDGLTGMVDLSKLVRSKAAGVFGALQNPQLFGRVFLEYGVVTWPGELDLAPDAMHAQIKKNGEWVLV